VHGSREGQRGRAVVAALAGVVVALLICAAASAAGTLTWTRVPGDPAVSRKGQVTNVSCLANGFCLTVGLTGQTAAWDGRAWHLAPGIHGVRFLSGLSCVSSSFCIAVGNNSTNKRTTNYALRWTGAGWGPPVELYATLGQAGFYDTVHAVSCTSARFCMAIGGPAGSYVFDGMRWSPHDGATGGTDGQGVLSCSSKRFCVNIHDNLPNYWNGSSWRWRRTETEADSIPKLADFISELSCASATFCVAVDPISTPLVFDGRSWRYSSVSVAKPGLTSVSCTNASFCIATSSTSGLALRWDGATWTPTSPLALGTNPTIVSCATTGHCLAVTDTGGAAVATS
jgi:hypothetical protein